MLDTHGAILLDPEYQPLLSECTLTSQGVVLWRGFSLARKIANAPTGRLVRFNNGDTRDFRPHNLRVRTGPSMSDVLVSPEDAHWLDQPGWCVMKHRATWYVVRRAKPKMELLHRLIAKTPEGWDTDHENGNGLDNRRENLRTATRAQNLQNRGKQMNNTSGVKGVYWHKQRQKWHAEIHARGQKHSLGLHATKEQAADAYQKAALSLHMEFARTEDFERLGD